MRRGYEELGLSARVSAPLTLGPWLAGSRRASVCVAPTGLDPRFPPFTPDLRPGLVAVVPEVTLVGLAELSQGLRSGLKCVAPTGLEPWSPLLPRPYVRG